MSAAPTFSVVMALGILSIASELDGLGPVSDLLLIVAAAVFAAILTANLRGAHTRPSGREAAMRTALLLFTWVAGVGVLGERLAGLYPPLAIIAAIVASLGWAPAMVLWCRHVERHACTWSSWDVDGSWLLVVVAAESLAILASTLAGMAAAAVFATIAFALWLLGLAIYPFLVAQIFRRIALRTLTLRELTPDYWIVTGALAISALAAIDVSHAMSRAGVDALLEPALVSVAGVALVCGALWVPVQLAAEMLQARGAASIVKHDWLRWSTVFPLGMLSVATHEFGQATGTGWLQTISLACFSVGVIVAALTTFGHAAAALALVRPSPQHR